MTLIVMWFFLVATPYATTTVGPFRNEAQCREAQAAVEKTYTVVLPCWRGQ